MLKFEAMSEFSINILAQWAIEQGVHRESDPNLKLLWQLDDLRKSVYAEHRIKIGFEEASKIAFAAVISKVIEIDQMVDRILGE